MKRFPDQLVQTKELTVEIDQNDPLSNRTKVDQAK